MTILSPLATGASHGTMAQAPTVPWRTDEEAQDYREDPTQFLLDRWELIKDNIVQVFHNWVIVLTYYMPDKLEFGNGHSLILPGQSHDEALWQGKVGLVVAKGPLAFKDDETVKFHGQNINVGDWVTYDILEGRQFTIERIHCRRLKDTQVIMQVRDPRLIY